MKRNPFPRRHTPLSREDIDVARWLMGETLSGTAESLNDVHQRGAALLVGIGRVRPLELSTVANLLSVDQETLQRALRGVQ